MCYSPPEAAEDIVKEGYSLLTCLKIFTKTAVSSTLLGHLLKMALRGEMG